MADLEPGFPLPNPFDSPSLDFILGLWEESVLDFSIDAPPPLEFFQVESSSPFRNSVQEVAGPSAQVDFDNGQCNSLEQNYQPSPFSSDLVIHGDIDSEPLDLNSASVDHFLSLEQAPETVEPVSSWVEPEQWHCVGCQALREIIHVNEIHTTKLEIHGMEGIIYHAILSVQSRVDGLTIDHQIVDFSMHGTETIKQFLLDYRQLRRQQGFVVVKDSLSAFYEALCAGMQDPTDANPVVPFKSYAREPDSTTAVGIKSKPVGFRHSPTKPPKSNVAAQRERTGKLQISDLVGYFHLPITVAAKKLAICPTVLKKICRRNGMSRWPHRKIKSIDRNISTLEQSLASQSGNQDGVAMIQAEINKLQRERARVCGGVVQSAKVDGKNSNHKF